LPWFANGPWLTKYIMKWYWSLRASLDQLGDKLLSLIITGVLLDEIKANSHKIMLGGLSDTLATRGAISLRNAMLRQELGK
jgi:hypothetical protein